MVLPAESKEAQDSYIIRWNHCYKAITSEDFPSNSVKIITGSFASDNRNYSFKDFVSTNTRFDQRRQLMSQMPKYVPQNNNPYRHPKECLLCDCVNKAIDEDVHCLYELSQQYIIPNIFPRLQGSAVFLPKDHDIDRKTCGRIIPPEEFDSLFEFCDTYDLVAGRNHVRDGMSIPRHDHFHLFPYEKTLLSDFSTQTDRIKTSHQNFLTVDDSPFSTLLIHSSKRSTLALQAAEIVHRLESEAYIFTLVYYQGVLLVSPRTMKSDSDAQTDIGCLAALHIFNGADEVLLRKILRFLPKRDEFPWDSILSNSNFKIANL